jgi:Outer membrane protein beta-barrel domain
MPTTSITKVFSVLAAVAAMLAPSWAAAQTVTLTVPYRGAGAMQTASTTIEFDASAVAAGATIVVAPLAPLVGPAGTVTVPALACGAACSASPPTATDDDIVVKRINGTNRVQLQITYFGSFSAPYCGYVGPVVPLPGDPMARNLTQIKTYDVTLTGFTFANATNGYRITSFMSPSTESCDIPYTRVPSQRPTVAGGLTRLGRLPLNAVMVLDQSGSMNWNIPGTMDQRWTAMRNAALLFTNVWDVVGAPPAPATVSSEGHADDRLGLIFFGTTAIEAPLDGANFFKLRGILAAPWGAAVAGAIPFAPPGGWTAIGAGVTNGRSRLDTVDAVQGDTAILLFTDGEQNRPPCVIHQGETISPIDKPRPDNPAMNYTDECNVLANIPGPLTLNNTLLARDVLPRGSIFTIGFGEGAMASSALLLNEIAEETAGRARFPITGALDVGQAFIDSLIDHLKGGTVSTIDRAVGTVAPGANASAPLMVPIDPSVTRTVFVLTWDGIGREIQLEIRRPDGTIVTAPLTENTSNSHVAGINLPSDGPAGTWQARLVRFSGTTGPINYMLSAHAVESRLGARITESGQLGTGNPVNIVAEIGWGDAGLADLPYGAVVATIERPDENLGDLLRRPLTGDVPKADEDSSPLAVKFHRLADTPGFLDRIQPKPLAQRVTLLSVGNGRYEGTFNGVIVGGEYKIRVEFDWTDARTGPIKIRRVHYADRPAAVLPSGAATQVEVGRDRNAAVIAITPRDGFGNYVGPGFERQFHVRVNGATVGPINDRDLTGRYVLRLTGVGPNDDPQIRIDYGGQTLRDTRLSQLSTGGRNTAVWFGFGATFPRNDFAVTHASGMAFNMGVERALTPSTSIEGTFGWHQFRDKIGTTDIDVLQFAANGKWYFKPAPVRPYVTLGIGVYNFDPGTTHFGVDGAFGVQGEIAPHWSLDGRATFVGTTNNAPNSPYWTLQLGLRYGF